MPPSLAANLGILFFALGLSALAFARSPRWSLAGFLLATAGALQLGAALHGGRTAGEAAAALLILAGVATVQWSIARSLLRPATEIPKGSPDGAVGLEVGRSEENLKAAPETDPEA